MRLFALLFLLAFVATYHDVSYENGWQKVETWDINGTQDEIDYFIGIHQPVWMGEKLVINLPNETLEFEGKHGWTDQA